MERRVRSGISKRVSPRQAELFNVSHRMSRWCGYSSLVLGPVWQSGMVIFGYVSGGTERSVKAGLAGLVQVLSAEPC